MSCEKSAVAAAASFVAPAAAAAAPSASSVSAIAAAAPRTHTIRLHTAQSMQPQHAVITMPASPPPPPPHDLPPSLPLPPPPPVPSQESSPPLPAAPSSRLRSPLHTQAGARPLSAVAALGATVPVSPCQPEEDEEDPVEDDSQDAEDNADASDDFDAVAVSNFPHRYAPSSTISRAHAEAQVASQHAAAQAAMEAAILRAAGLPTEAEEDYSLGVDTVVAPLHSPSSAAHAAAGGSSALTPDIVPDDYASDEGRYDKFLHWMASNGAVFPHLTLKRYEKNYRGVHISTSGANAPKDSAASAKDRQKGCEEEKEDEPPLSPTGAGDCVTPPPPSQPQHISSTSLPLPSPPRTPADANVFSADADAEADLDPECESSPSPLSAASASPSSMSATSSAAATMRALDAQDAQHGGRDVSPSPSPSPSTPPSHELEREGSPSPSAPSSPSSASLVADPTAVPAASLPGSGPTIAKGTILLSIPHHLLITVELARASPLGALIAPLPNLGSQAILSVYLLQEMFKQRMWKRQQVARAEKARAEGQREREREKERKVALVERVEEEECKSICPPAPAVAPPALPSPLSAAPEPTLSPSFWSPWLEVLPSSFSTLPLFFTPGETAGLEGCTELLSKIAAQRRSTREEFTVIKGVMMQEYVRHVMAVRAWEAAQANATAASPTAAVSSLSSLSKQPAAGRNACPAPLIPLFLDFLRGFSYASFVWGCLAVGTRVFSLQIQHVKTSVLAPLADMMNHRTPSGTNWTYDSRRASFTLTSCTELGDGEAVYESYGIKDNKRFFASYGFCLEENQANEATLMVRGDSGFGGGDGGMQEDHDDPESTASQLASTASAPVRTFVLHGCWDHLSEDVLNFLRIANVYEFQMEQEQQAQAAAAAQAEAEAEAQAAAAAAATAEQEEADLQQEEDELILAEGHAARRAAAAASGSTETPAPTELTPEESAALARIEARRAAAASGGVAAASATAVSQAPITEQDFQSMLAQRLYARQTQQQQQSNYPSAASRRPAPVMLRSPSPFATSGPISLDNELSALYTLRQSCRQTLLHYPTTLLEDAALLAGLSRLDARAGGVPPELGNLRNILVFRMGEKKVLHYWIDLATLAIALMCAPWDAPTHSPATGTNEAAAQRRRIQQRALDLSGGRSGSIAPLSPHASCKAKVRYLLQTGSVSGILAPFVDRSARSRAAAHLSPAHAAREMERKLYAAVGITLPAVPVPAVEKSSAVTAANVAVGHYRSTRKTGRGRGEYSEQKEGKCRPFTAPLSGAHAHAASESDAPEDEEEDDDDDEFSCALSCPPSLSLLLQDLAATHGPNRAPIDPSQGPPAQGAMSYITAVVVPLQQSRWRAMQKRRRKKMLALKIKQAQHAQQQQQMRMHDQASAMHQRGGVVRLMRDRTPSDSAAPGNGYFDSQRNSLSATHQPPPHPRELKQPSSAAPHWRSQLAHLQSPDDHELSHSHQQQQDHSGYGGELEESSNLLRYNASASAAADTAAELNEHSHSDLLDRTPRSSRRFQQMQDAGEAGEDDDGAFAEEHTHLDRLSRRRELELAELEASQRDRQAAQQQEAHLLSHVSHPRSLPYSEAELYSYYTRHHSDHHGEQDDDEDCSEDEEDEDVGEFFSDPEEDEDDAEHDEDQDDEDDEMDSDLDLMHAAHEHEIDEQVDDDAEFGGERSHSAAEYTMRDEAGGTQRSRRIHQLSHLLSDDSEPEGEDVPASAAPAVPAARPVSAADSERRLRAELHEMQSLQQQQLAKARAHLHSASVSRRSRTDSAVPTSRNHSRVGFARPQSGLRPAASDSATLEGAEGTKADASAISSRSASRSASRAAFLASWYDSVQAAQRDRLLKSREGGSRLTASRGCEAEREEDSIMRDDDQDTNPLDSEPHQGEEDQVEQDQTKAATTDAVSPRASESVRPSAHANIAAVETAEKVATANAASPSPAPAVHRPAPITVVHDASSTAIATKPVIAPAAVASTSSLPRSLPIAIPVSSYHRPVSSTAAAASAVAAPSTAAVNLQSTTAKVTIAVGQRKKVLSASTPRAAINAAAVDAPLPAPVLPPLVASSPQVTSADRFPSPSSSPAIPPAVAARVQRPLSLTRSPLSPSQVAARSTAAASPLSPLTLSSSQGGSSYAPSPRSSGAQLTPSPPPSKSRSSSLGGASSALPVTPTRLLPSVCNAQGYAIVSPNGSPPRLLRVASASSATSSPSSAVAAAAQLRGSPTRLPQVLSPATALSAQLQLGSDRSSPPSTSFPSVQGATRTSSLSLGATAPVHSSSSGSSGAISPSRSRPALHVPRELKFDSPTRHGSAVHAHSYSAYQLPNGSYLNASSPASSPLRGSYAPPTAASRAAESPRGAGAAAASASGGVPSPTRRRISLSQSHAPVRAGPAYMSTAAAASSSSSSSLTVASASAAGSVCASTSTFVTPNLPRKVQSASPWSVPATLPASMHRPYAPSAAAGTAASPSSSSSAAASASPPHSLSGSPPSTRCYSLPLPPSHDASAGRSLGRDAPSGLAGWHAHGASAADGHEKLLEHAHALSPVAIAAAAV